MSTFTVSRCFFPSDLSVDRSPAPSTLWRWKLLEPYRETQVGMSEINSLGLLTPASYRTKEIENVSSPLALTSERDWFPRTGCSQEQRGSPTPSPTLLLAAEGTSPVPSTLGSQQVCRPPVFAEADVELPEERV